MKNLGGTRGEKLVNLRLDRDSIRLLSSTAMHLQFAALQWPEVFLVLSMMSAALLVVGIVIYFAVRAARKK